MSSHTCQRRTAEEINTRTWSSRPVRSGSVVGDLIAKAPAVTTTISGQSGQSLTLSLGLRQRLVLPTCVSTPSHLVAAGGVFSMASFAAMAFVMVMQLRRNQVIRRARSRLRTSHSRRQATDPVIVHRAWAAQLVATVASPKRSPCQRDTLRPRHCPLRLQPSVAP